MRERSTRLAFARIEAAKFCLSTELAGRQRQLTALIAEFDARLSENGIRRRSAAQSPIHFGEIGDERAAMHVGAALKERGYFVNVAVFPAVPRRRAGLRVMLNCHHTTEDVRGLVSEIVRAMAAS